MGEGEGGQREGRLLMMRATSNVRAALTLHAALCFALALALMHGPLLGYSPELRVCQASGGTCNAKDASRCVKDQWNPKCFLAMQNWKMRGNNGSREVYCGELARNRTDKGLRSGTRTPQ